MTTKYDNHKNHDKHKKHSNHRRIQIVDKNDNRVVEAQKNRRERIYVCSPLRPTASDPEQAEKELAGNLEHAKDACRMITDLGGIPVCSHLFFTQFLKDDDPEERRTGRNLGLELLKDCDELWCFSSKISEGMLEEISLAARLGMPVRMFSSDSGGLIGRLLEGIDEKMPGKITPGNAAPGKAAPAEGNPDVKAAGKTPNGEAVRDSSRKEKGMDSFAAGFRPLIEIAEELMRTMEAMNM